MNKKIIGMIPSLIGGMVQRLASVTAKSTSLLGLILNATLDKEGKVLLTSLNTLYVGMHATATSKAGRKAVHAHMSNAGVKKALGLMLDFSGNKAMQDLLTGLAGRTTIVLKEVAQANGTTRESLVVSQTNKGEKHAKWTDITILGDSLRMEAASDKVITDTMHAEISKLVALGDAETVGLAVEILDTEVTRLAQVVGQLVEARKSMIEEAVGPITKLVVEGQGDSASISIDTSVAIATN